MARTLEQLDAIAALRAEINATRTLVLSDSAPRADRELAQDRLSLLTEKLLGLETTLPPPPPPPIVDPATAPAVAAARAASIRSDPRFWNSRLTDQDGNRLITPSAHADLLRELRECDAIASAVPEGGEDTES